MATGCLEPFIKGPYYINDKWNDRPVIPHAQRKCHYWRSCSKTGGSHHAQHNFRCEPNPKYWTQKDGIKFKPKLIWIPHLKRWIPLHKPKDVDFFQFVVVPPKVTKIISLGSSKTLGCQNCCHDHPVCERYESHLSNQLRRCQSDVAEDKISSTKVKNEVLTTRHSVSAGINGRAMKKTTSWNSFQGLLRNNSMPESNHVVQKHAVPPASPSSAEDAIQNTLEALDMESPEKLPMLSGKQKSKSSLLADTSLSNSLKEKQTSKNSKKIENHTDEGKLNLTKNTGTITDMSNKIQDLEIQFAKDAENLSKDITGYLEEYSEGNNRTEMEENSSILNPITEKPLEENNAENLSPRRTGINIKAGRQEPKENGIPENSLSPSKGLSRKTGVLNQLPRSGKEAVKQLVPVTESEAAADNISEDVVTSSNDIISEEENQELSVPPSDDNPAVSANGKLENSKRKTSKASLIKSVTIVEQQPSKYGKPRGHMQYFDPSEAAERRRKKLLDKINQKRQLQLATKESRGPHFEDYGFLAKYCIFNKESWDVYRRIFEMGDADKKGWLTTEEMLLGLRSINSQLTAPKEEYLCRIIEMTGYSIEDGADFQLFAILAALSNRITSLDDWMKNIVDRFDYQLLDMKTFKCKTLWECNVDPDTHKISLDQLCVDLKAGGVSLSHEEEVRSKLQHLNALDLLDFLTYVPLFIMVHNSVVDNPLDSTWGS
ncbi:uncharacterized protein LOC115219818 isoform X2 [Octopus sinensis]|nr:uncharacterized protein LOC115219818 isoform X2 [Octopus sinensis]